jgi:glycosyltransferase involved in cell wall biosynthesis
MPRPAAIICPSRYLTDLAKAAPAFQGIPVHCIPYGLRMLDCPERRISRGEARKHFGLDLHGNVILLVAARLDSPYKGMDLALEVVRRLKKPSLQLLLLGHNARGFAQGLPAAKVVAPGWVCDDAVMAMAYRAADVAMVPSRADNFPYVALESLACATPFVTFRVGGLAEIAGENERGLVAPPFDVDLLAANTQFLLSRPEEAQALGLAGQRWVEQQCQMSASTTKNLSVYQQILHQSIA